MKTKLPISDKTRAFTLIEVMVSMVIVLILVLVFSTMTDRTAKIWRDTRGKVSQFQARAVQLSLPRQRLSFLTHKKKEPFFFLLLGIPSNTKLIFKVLITITIET